MADLEAPAPAPAPAGNQTVQLGMGTMILIALIVTMCSGGKVDELRGDINQLKQQNTEINQKLDTLLARDAASANAAAQPTGQ